MLKVQDINLSLLKPWEDNPRINDEAIDAVAKSIELFGFNVPILCDRQFNIIAGHTRWKAAKKIGMELVPVIVLEIMEDQREAFAIADNKTATLSRWDYPKLRKILENLKYKKINLLSLGYSHAELQALLTRQKEFNWKIFDEHLKIKQSQVYVLLPIKIRMDMHKAFKESIKQYAIEHSIDEKDFAKTAGKVLGFLLGLQQ